MRHTEVQKVATEKPFRPFVVEMVDGHTYTFDSPEAFTLSPSAIYTADRSHHLLVLGMDMIARISVPKSEAESRVS